MRGRCHSDFREDFGVGVFPYPRTTHLSLSQNISDLGKIETLICSLLGSAGSQEFLLGSPVRRKHQSGSRISGEKGPTPKLVTDTP